MIDPINIGGLLVGIVAALGAWASARQTARASRLSAKEAAEHLAYERADAMNQRTIDRQAAEIVRLKTENESLRSQLEGK